MKIVSKSTINNLLSYFLEYHFQEKLLTNVSTETFAVIKKELIDIFDDLELTDADVKEAWKAWFDEAAYNGTLVAPFIQLPDYDEIRIMDQFIELANNAIDSL